MLIQVGELAKRAGMTVRTLHHYEQTGLLTPSARSAAGYRLYNLAAVQRLHMIKALAQAGLELATIKDYLDRDALAVRPAGSRSPRSTGSCKPSPRCAPGAAAKSWQRRRARSGVLATDAGVNENVRSLV
jgi:DNA-binding transcriptional MerR regulator